MVRILAIDENAIVRRGLKELLADEIEDMTFGEARGRDALDLVRKRDWDVILLDISMIDTSGLELLKQLRALRPKTPLLAISVCADDQFAVRVLRAGAAGYIQKDCMPEEMAQAVKKLLKGGRYVSTRLAEKLAQNLEGDPARAPHELLSDREFEVMRMIASGKSVTEIAESLSLSVKTVSTYRARILEKMRVKNNAEITRYAIFHGLVR